MTVTFDQRHKGYKVGVVLLLVGLWCFCMGFASSSWYVRNTLKTDRHPKEMTEDFHFEGLWKTCTWSVPSVDSIFFCSYHYATGWFLAVQTLQSLSLAASIMAAIYFFVVNVVTNSPGKISRAGECTVYVAVCLGFVGLVVYAAERNDHRLPKLEESTDLKSAYDSNTENKQGWFSWSFYVDLVGLFILLVAAIIVSIFNRPLLQINTLKSITESTCRPLLQINTLKSITESTPCVLVQLTAPGWPGHPVPVLQEPQSTASVVGCGTTSVVSG